MLKLLREMDQFGVVFQPRIKYSRDQYKTYFGGIMSIFLYGLCLTYLTYLLFQWQKGEILPKITSQSAVKNDYQLSLNETYLTFYADLYDKTKIDPFKPKAIILQPSLSIYRNGVRQQLLMVEYSVDINKHGFTRISVKNLQLTLSSLYNDEVPQIEYEISLGQCIKDLLKEGEECANDSTIQKFYEQQTNFIVVNQFVKEFNIATQQLEIINRESLIPIQQNYVYYARNYVQITQTQVDQGFLFEQWQFYQHITNYRLQVSIFDIQFLQENILIVFSFSIDNIQQKQVITYSKISEILANAGSIASTILLFSYLILTLNQSQMQFQAINKVVSMYYPDFKDIKIKRNLLGRIVQASINGRLLDLPSFKKYYEKLSKIGEFKLTISNQIYEISRIQLLLQQIISKEQILLTHKKGLPMQNFYIDAQNEENQNIDQSIVYETRSKKSCVVPITDKGQMIIQMIESKSNHISMGLQTTDHTFTDADFSLLVMPNEHTQDKQQLQNIQEFVIQQD